MSNDKFMARTYTTDWLGSSPVFYNEETGMVSHNINEVIDYRHLKFDPEGLRYYLDFGYSVFNLTPVKNVKFLGHSHKLSIAKGRKPLIKKLDDPWDHWNGRATKVNDVLGLMYDQVRKWESEQTGEVIIPTSGGYDSRLLNLLIKDKSRIRSFSFGVSDRQRDSFEVVYAKKLSEMLGTRWEWIKLGEYHKFFPEWDGLYGPSTHAHGMYHIEFYRKVLEKVAGGNAFLSGIIGDAWSGNVTIPSIDSPDKVYYLGYSHGMHADSAQSLLKADRNALGDYFSANRIKLRDKNFRIIESMRFKLMLLSYLIRVPASFGFKPWSPFLLPDVVLSMLSLPEKEKIDRKWQQDFFRRFKVDFENQTFPCDKTNTLNLQALRMMPLSPLRVNLLREIINPQYLEWINSKIHYATFSMVRQKLYDRLALYPIIEPVISKFGLAEGYNLGSETIKAYCAYLTLKPLEYLIIKRNKA